MYTNMLEASASCNKIDLYNCYPGYTAYLAEQHKNSKIHKATPSDQTISSLCPMANSSLYFPALGARGGPYL
jgi:hypothetical protein